MRKALTVTGRKIIQKDEHSPLPKWKLLLCQWLNIKPQKTYYYTFLLGCENVNQSRLRDVVRIGLQTFSIIDIDSVASTVLAVSHTCIPSEAIEWFFCGEVFVFSSVTPEGAPDISNYTKN